MGHGRYAASPRGAASGRTIDVDVDDAQQALQQKSSGSTLVCPDRQLVVSTPVPIGPDARYWRALGHFGLAKLESGDKA